MAIQYKPTKQKKEKPAKAPKAPKAPKAEKPIKIGSVQKVKATKPAKPPKAPKVEKVKAVAPAFKGGKVKKSEDLERTSALKKPVNLVAVLSVMAVLVVVAVLAITVFLPAVEDNGQEIKEIVIVNLPSKTVYLIGEELSTDGLKVLATRKNGESFTVRADKCQLDGFNSAKAGHNTITINYEGLVATFSVLVEEPPRPTPALLEISFETLPKTEYRMGERLDTAGGVIRCEYDDGSITRVNLVNGYVSGFSAINGPGEYELTVKYKENGITVKTTYTITVTE